MDAQIYHSTNSQNLLVENCWKIQEFFASSIDYLISNFYLHLFLLYLRFKLILIKLNLIMLDQLMDIEYRHNN